MTSTLQTKPSPQPTLYLWNLSQLLVLSIRFPWLILMCSFPGQMANMSPSAYNSIKPEQQMNLRLDPYGYSFASAWTTLRRIAVRFKPVFKIRVPWISWEEALLVALCLTTVSDEISDSKLIHTSVVMKRTLAQEALSSQESLMKKFWALNSGRTEFVSQLPYKQDGGGGLDKSQAYLTFLWNRRTRVLTWQT